MLRRIQDLKLSAAAAAAAATKSLYLYPTLCNPMDGSPPGSHVPGILQARTLEWVAISFSNAWKWKVKVKSLSRVRLPATPWTAAYQAPPSMGFSRQEYWSGVPCLLWKLSAREYEIAMINVWTSQVELVMKNLPANAGNKKYSFDPWPGKILWRKAWQPTSVFLPGDSYGQGVW